MSDSPRTMNRTTNRTSNRRGRSRPQHGAGGATAASRRRGQAPDPTVKTELDRLLDEAQNTPAPDATSFAETGLPTPLVEALAAQGMKQPFAIQARTLPDALAGRDILGRAQTGSGKTLGFGLPMLARLSGGKRGSGTPRGLVLVPTRELAKQVADALAPLGRPLGVRIATVFGGAPINRQINDLQRGVDMVVATPGRLIDLMDRRAVTLDQVRITVLDEADYMADLGFLPAVTRIMDATPDGGQRMLFSATLDRGVDRLVSRYLTDPSVHAVAPAASPVESMEHKVFTVQSEDKVAVAAEVAARPGRTLFFVRTKHGADRLAKQLERQGVEAAAIHGNLGQNARQRALDAFTSGRPRVLVATDVAARGIHVDDVDLVVHFDPPNDHKDYLHRSGRTARAGTSGTVVALVQPEQARGMSRLHRDAKVVPDVTAVHPGHDAVREVATSGTPVVVRPLAAPTRSTRPTGRPSRSKGRRQTAADRGRRR
ncbi:MAG TPA: DEAD/DEAH box helicase [Actinomycetales bacterium]|nr:DEAD/DEAH box helicase [Actinomycetales bacterium]